MKKLLLLSIIVLITIFSIEGCKKDSKPDPEVEMEEPNLPGIMMTLSAISYIADGSSATIIKDSIVHLLADTSLATNGNWQLAWGPGISTNNENLAFVVKYTTGQTPAYAIAIRGTNINSIGDIIEDINVFKLVEFPYGMSGDSVAKGAMDGLEGILTAIDNTDNTTLEEYLLSISGDAKTPLFVTGHSQGGGLAPLMAYWLITNDQFNEKFTFTTYAFAGPGFVNKNFRDNFLSTLPPDASFHMSVNSLDMIPYGYADLPGIISKNIPVHVPLLYKIIISSANDTLIARGIKYYNIVVADTIGHIPIQPTVPGGILPSDTIKWYDHWLATEHSHNNYLLLMGVKPLNQ